MLSFQHVTSRITPCALQLTTYLFTYWIFPRQINGQYIMKINWLTTNHNKTLKSYWFLNCKIVTFEFEYYMTNSKSVITINITTNKSLIACSSPLYRNIRLSRFLINHDIRNQSTSSIEIQSQFTNHIPLSLLRYNDIIRFWNKKETINWGEPFTQRFTTEL